MPIGKADLKREGQDISIITYGAMIHQSLKAAEELSKEDIDVEVLDLRTILPLDKEAILASSGRPARCWSSPRTPCPSESERK